MTADPSAGRIACDRCEAEIPVFDAVTGLAQCDRCGLVFEPMYQPAPESGTSRPLVKQRPPVKAPEGFVVEVEEIPPISNLGGPIVPYREMAVDRKPRPEARALVRWKWGAMGPGCGNLMAAIGGGSIGTWLTYLIVTHPGAPIWFVALIGLLDLIAVGAAYAAFGQLLNRTTIALRDGVLRISHGPIPWKRARVIPAVEIEQIWSTRIETRKTSKSGPYVDVTYGLEAALSGGSKLRLVSHLEDAQQALYVEQVLEHALGIVDVAVPGELKERR